MKLAWLLKLLVTLTSSNSCLLPVRGVVRALEPEEALLSFRALLPSGLVWSGAGVEARVKYNSDGTRLLICPTCHAQSSTPEFQIFRVSVTFSAIPEVLAGDIRWPGEESVSSGAVGGGLRLLCWEKSDLNFSYLDTHAVMVCPYSWLSQGSHTSPGGCRTRTRPDKDVAWAPPWCCTPSTCRTAPRQAGSNSHRH